MRELNEAAGGKNLCLMQFALHETPQDVVSTHTLSYCSVLAVLV